MQMKMFEMPTIYKRTSQLQTSPGHTQQAVNQHMSKNREGQLQLPRQQNAIPGHFFKTSPRTNETSRAQISDAIKDQDLQAS